MGLHLCLAPPAVSSPLYRLLQDLRRRRPTAGHQKSENDLRTDHQGPQDFTLPLHQPQHRPAPLQEQGVQTTTPPGTPLSPSASTSQETPPVTVSLTVGVPGAPEITLSFLLS
nr:MAG: E4 protein [Neophocaena asiaeorientalis asiaeorientalis papillomavirus 3]